jgi:hypothetical protein
MKAVLVKWAFYSPDGSDSPPLEAGLSIVRQSSSGPDTSPSAECIVRGMAAFIRRLPRNHAFHCAAGIQATGIFPLNFTNFVPTLAWVIHKIVAKIPYPFQKLKGAINNS